MFTFVKKKKKKSPNCLPKWLSHFSFPPAMNKSSYCSISSLAFAVVSILEFGYSNRRVVISYCCFNLQSPNDMILSHFLIFYYPMGFLEGLNKPTEKWLAQYLVHNNSSIDCRFKKEKCYYWYIETPCFLGLKDRGSIWYPWLILSQLLLLINTLYTPQT